MNDKNTPYTKGIRLGNYTIVREKILEHLEKAFVGELTPQEALDKAVQEGNQLLAEFERHHLSNLSFSTEHENGQKP